MLFYVYVGAGSAISAAWVLVFVSRHREDVRMFAVASAVLLTTIGSFAALIEFVIFEPIPAYIGPMGFDARVEGAALGALIVLIPVALRLLFLRYR